MLQVLPFSHRQPEALSEGGSIKIPAWCSVNVVNSLLMEKISHAYISAKAEDDKLPDDQQLASPPKNAGHFKGWGKIDGFTAVIHVRPDLTPHLRLSVLTPPTHVHACECVCIYVSASQNWKFERLFSVSEVLPWVCSVYWELWEMRGGTGVGNCSWRRGRGCSLNSQSSCFGLLRGPENAAIPELHHI